MVYDSRHLQADCQEPGSARQSNMSYLYLIYVRKYSWTIFYLDTVYIAVTGKSSVKFTNLLSYSLTNFNRSQVYLN